MNVQLSTINDLPELAAFTANNIKSKFLNATNKYYIELTTVDNNTSKLQSDKIDLALLLNKLTNTITSNDTPNDQDTPNASKILNAVREKIYPVGSLYISFDNNANPKELLGFGTWLRIENRAIWCCGDNDVAGTSPTASIPAPEVSIDFKCRSDVNENTKALKDRSFIVTTDIEQSLTPADNLQPDVYSSFLRCRHSNYNVQSRNFAITTQNHKDKLQINAAAGNYLRTAFGLNCSYLKMFADMEPVINVDTGNASIYDANSTVAKPTCINAYAWRRTA